MAIGGANKAGVPIAVCGEMAGELQLTRLLLGLGLREFLDASRRICWRVKQRVLQSDVAAGTALVERIRRADDPGQARGAARQAERLSPPARR